MRHDSSADAGRDDPGWLGPVAADLELWGVPLLLACWTLALLEATELDMVPAPRVRWGDDGRLTLTWQAGDRYLRLEREDRSCRWDRAQSGRILDVARPLRCDHAAVLRDLLGWLIRGETVTFRAEKRGDGPRRKEW